MHSTKRGTCRLRASFSRYAGQLATGTIGYANPAATAGFAVYGWNDLDGDHLVENNEVNFNTFVTSGGGFNRANPAAVDLDEPHRSESQSADDQHFVLGVDRELRPNLAVQANYTYTRVSNLFGNLFAAITPRVGVAPGVNGNYTPGAGFSGTLPDGTPYNIATYIPSAALVTASGGGFLETNIPGYYTDNHGVEIALTRRMTGRWMGRLSLAFNNAREHFTNANGVYDTNGNPTPTITEPLVDGGAFSPQSTGNGQGAIYMNARWQFNANGMYVAPYGIRAGGQRVRTPGLSGTAVSSWFDSRPRRRLVAECVGLADDRLRPLSKRVGHGLQGRARFQGRSRQHPWDVRRVQPLQCQHGARSKRQHPRRRRSISLLKT